MATVRDWLAAAMGLGRAGEVSGAEGVRSDQELSEQQRAAVVRGLEVVRRYGGVLLADAVGLGKTRVATHLARRVVRDVHRRRRSVEPALFVVPARLRKNWRRAINAVGWQCGRDAEIVSHHGLSRRPWPDRPPVVVVDEAHRFRNPDAKRSRHLAQLCARAFPILVTATPVCTEGADLRQLLGYFLSDSITKSMVGLSLEAAFAADEAGEFDIVEILERVVIRRRQPDFGTSGRPAVRFESLPYATDDDEAWMWRNLEPSLRALSLAATGEHWPRGLLINNLLRMWESGPEALRKSLDELCHFHERWLDAQAMGRRVERPQFRTLFAGVDRRQGVFPFLYGPGGTSGSNRARRGAVAEDLQALKGLIQRVDRIRRQGSAMIGAIEAEVETRGEERFLIFAAFRAAAQAIYEALARRGMRVGLITGQRAQATGLGMTTDSDVLDRFLDPRRDERGRRHRLRVLVATDCLSEGVNLQGCTRMILADLPYSPVKLEQRVGRIARPGSAVSRVTIYLPRPESWTDSLGLRRTLGRRLELADNLGTGLGLAGAVMGSSTPEQSASPGPLAAMTGEERLWRLVASTASHKSAVPMQASVSELDMAQARLWARVELDGALSHHVWISVSPGSREPVVRLSEQLPGLARLADDERPIRSWEPGGDQLDVIKQWIRRRRGWLEAARLAPALLGAGSEPVRMWRLLRDATRRGQLNADGATLASWRRKLLRAHPSGIRFEMEEMLEKESGAQQIAHFTNRLSDPGKAQPTTLRLVGLLRA